MAFLRSNIKMLSIALAAVLSISTISFLWLLSESAGNFRIKVKETILRTLAEGKSLPPGEVVDVIYVLGGSERSLKHKYQVVAGLYKGGVADKVWVMSHEGITSFSEELGRNLTNDEWSIRKLKQLGVPQKSVEAVKMEEGFFGTLSEAKGISRVVQERGYKSILLVSEKYHTKRVYASFERFLPVDTVTFYTENSADGERLSEVLIELIKLTVYRLLV